MQTNNTAPTRPEIAAAIGVRNKSTVTDHLEALARKGLIELRHGRERYIRLLRNDFPIVVAGEVAAGTPVLAEENASGWIPRAVAEVFRPAPTFFIRVTGTSMNLCGYIDGAHVAIRSQAVAENGEVVVARIDDEVTLKRYFRKSRRYVELRPESSDPAHQPIEVDLKHEAFEICGVVVGALIGDGFERANSSSSRRDRDNWKPWDGRR